MKVKELIAALNECEMDNEISIDTEKRTIHITGVSSNRRIAQLEISETIIAVRDVEST